MSYGITPRQSSLMAMLRRHKEAGAATPSYDEMKDALGLASKSGVSRMIDALVERGLLRKMPGHRYRSIEIVDDQEIVLTPYTKKKLDLYCHTTGFKLSAVVNNAVVQYIAANPLDPAKGRT